MNASDFDVSVLYCLPRAARKAALPQRRQRPLGTVFFSAQRAHWTRRAGEGNGDGMTFPTPSPADWKALAEKALKDKPLESLVHLDADSLVVRPLYAGVTGVETVFAPRPSDAVNVSPVRGAWIAAARVRPPSTYAMTTQ